ncbi:MAG: MerR family transcriptional regulator [Synergistaceae bacterium]|jgi:DNA-binding transcriptional MerR regulator|nr:MerR family transcriptional regulator [Synergistaceae bacterium]
MRFLIGKFSTITNIDVRKLRYYERMDVIVPQREKGGRRYYKESDINWIGFVKRLEDTGMPIGEIQRFAALRSEGKSTLNERISMLINHRTAIEDEIRKLFAHLSKIDDEMNIYRAEAKIK